MVALNVKKAPAKKQEYNDKVKPVAVRESNINAAKAVADAIRTSLGPNGMDKMIQEGKGDVTITNDGATILKRMKLLHPAGKMMVDLSKSQDIEAGDGTTSVVVLAGNLLDATQSLLKKGIHPTTISESFTKAAEKATDFLESISLPVDLDDRELLLKMASTALNSKVVRQNASFLAPIAVDSVLKIYDDASPDVVNLSNIKTVMKLGGTVDDCEMVDGLLIDRRVESLCKVHRVEKAKIALIQFCISPPKTDMDHNVVVSDYTEMDRVLREERQYILEIVKVIKASGCNVLLIQKSILRDAINDLALHFFAKLGIMVVKDIERTDIQFICKTLDCKPIASLDHFKPEMLAKAELVEEVTVGDSKVVAVKGITNPGKTVSILMRGSNKLLLEEAERSLHDSQCVIRCLVKKRFMVAGGGAPEMEMSQKLNSYANTLPGLDQYCFRAFAQALEVIPYTLAENCGLPAVEIVTDLKYKHAKGDKNAGVNVSKGCTSDMFKDDVLQPMLVTYSAVRLAAETVRCLLKIDDIVSTVR